MMMKDMCRTIRKGEYGEEVSTCAGEGGQEGGAGERERE